jgi:hypothetical protein
MDTSRKFVLHRNDHGIPPNRTIKIVDSKSAKLENYPVISVIIPTSDGYRDGYFPSLMEQNVREADFY